MYVNNNGMYSGYKLFDEPAIAMRIFAQKVEREKKLKFQKGKQQFYCFRFETVGVVVLTTVCAKVLLH